LLVACIQAWLNLNSLALLIKKFSNVAVSAKRNLAILIRVCRGLLQRDLVKVSRSQYVELTVTISNLTI
jgi:hypothetical protein